MIARFLAALAALAGATPALADTLIDNVDVVAFAADGRVRHFEGLVIDGEGRVAQLLEHNDKRPRRPDFRLDGQGRTLLPGLIATRVDVTRLGLALLLAKPSVTRANGEAPGGPPRPEDRDLAFSEAQQALLARGVTAIGTAGTTIEDWQSYRRAGDAGTLRLRLACYAAGIDAMVLIGGPGPTPWLYDQRLRLNGVVLPFAATRDALAETRLRNQMSRAAMDHFQVAVAPGSLETVAAVLGAVAELGQTYKGDRRWRILATTPPAPADAAQAATLGVLVDSQPAVAPVSLDALAQMPARAGEAGLAAWTADAARTLLADGRFGKLARGEMADFILVEGKPFDPAGMTTLRVTETWIGGKPAWRTSGATYSTPDRGTADQPAGR